MGQLPFLNELVIVAAVVVVAALLMRLLRLPAIAGFLFTGAVVGPYGFAFIRDTHTLELMAEVGVILLLFSIGLEFSLSKLRSIGKLLAIGGSLQVGLTIAGVTALAVLLGRPASQGVFFGFVFALSSTAIVLRGLAERREVDAPHGRFIVGTLIFQDLCIVPMMLVVPILGGQGSDNPVADIAWALGKATLLVAVVILVARFAVPRFFARVDSTRSREVFLFAVLAICIGTALLTSLVGLSLALGAFLAGVVLAESDFGDRALSDVVPLRDLFTSLFFVSLGTLFDLHVLAEEPLLVGLVFLVMFVGKGLLATVAVLPFRPPLRVAVLTGVGLAQFGEFGFVLIKAGLAIGLVGALESRILLTAGVLTMFVTPVAVRLAPTLGAGAAKLQRLSKLLGVADISQIVDEHEKRSGHVVIGGYGVAGQVVATALRKAGIPYLVLELNAEKVRQARAQGEPIWYGDVSTPEALTHAQTGTALALVLLINDPEAARRTLQAARRHFENTPVLMRAHDVQARERLLKKGATEVVCEEVESGIEMLARMLRRMDMPRNVLIERLQQARKDTSPAPALPSTLAPKLSALAGVDGMKLESFLVRPNAYALGRSSLELDLVSQTGALIVSLQRGKQELKQPTTSEPFQEGDLLYLMGTATSVFLAVTVLEVGPTTKPQAVSA